MSADPMPLGLRRDGPAPPAPTVPVVLVLGRSSGGIGTHVGQLADDLRALGVPVVVVTHASTAQHFGWADALTWWPDDARSLAAWPGRLRSLLREPGPDDRDGAGPVAVHAHGLQAALAVAGALPRRGGRLGRCRLLVSLHNPLPAASGPRARALAAATSWALRRADLVTGASSDLVDLARTLGARAPRLAPVPSPLVPGLLAAPGPDPDRTGECAARLGLGAGPDRPLLLTVSRLAPQKRLDVAADAAGLMRHGADVVWAVAGAGSADDLARLRASSPGTWLRVLGARDDVPDLLRAATALVLTSDWEARALVVQEAMAAGVPVVATEVGGIPGLLEGTGRLVPAGSPGELAEALDGLVDDWQADPARLAARGADGRAVAATWPDGAATARQWATWYGDPPADDLD